jgi:hypothetical protein
VWVQDAGGGARTRYLKSRNRTKVMAPMKHENIIAFSRAPENFFSGVSESCSAVGCAGWSRGLVGSSLRVGRSRIHLFLVGD